MHWIAPIQRLEGLHNKAPGSSSHSLLEMQEQKSRPDGSSVCVKQASDCNSQGTFDTFQLESEFSDAFFSVFKVERKVSAIAFQIQICMFM